MKKCFTINPLRTKEEIESYYYLFEEGIYQAIEIFYPYNLDNDTFNVYTNSIHSLINKFKNIEVVMHLPHGYKNNLCDLNGYIEILKRMKEGIDYSNQFGIKKLTLHLGIIDLNTNREIYLGHIVNVLTELCDYASKYQMYIMIENMPGIKELGYSPDEILYIIEKVNLDNLKFILDTGHANVSEYEISEYIYKLKEYLYHLHLSDNDGTRDAHARLGLGNIDFYQFIVDLKKINYSELYCLEIIFKEANELLRNAKSLDKYDN
ncbi:MAG: sugar phosphate isomerase/epimerase family protein [Bacilli bacterium]